MKDKSLKMVLIFMNKIETPKQASNGKETLFYRGLYLPRGYTVNRIQIKGHSSLSGLREMHEWPLHLPE